MVTLSVLASMAACLFLFARPGHSVARYLNRLAVRETVGNHFSEVIVDALTRYYVQNHSATMVTRLATVSWQTFHLQSDIMDEVMQRTSHSIAYVFGAANQRNRRPRYFNIAFVDGHDAFEQLFRSLDPAHNDFAGYYLVVLTTLGRLLPFTLQRIFAFLWSLNVVNVNVITADLEDHSRWQSVLMYTYYPYRAGDCERIVPSLVHRFRKGQPLDRMVEIFPDKLSNFHGCRLLVGTFHLPPYMLLQTDDHNARQLDDRYGGVEGDLLRALAKKLNFTVQLVQPSDAELWGVTGEPRSAGSYPAATGCVRLVLQGRVNLTLGRFAFRGDRNLAMKHSRSYYTVRMMFAVPPGRPYTPFEKLFRPFARTTWLLVALYLGTGATTIVAIEAGRAAGRVRAFVYGRGVRTPMLNLLAVLFGGTMLRLPGRNFARTLLSLWMCHCLVMRSLYQGSLFEYLQEGKNFSHPQTVQALLDNGYSFFSMRGSAKYLEQIPAVSKRVAWLPDDDAAVERHLHTLASFGAREALFSDVDRVGYYNRQHHRTGYVHTVGEVLVALPIGFYYPKKTCLVNAFDREIDNILMSGYFNQQLRHYVSYDFFRRQPHRHEPSPLTSDQLVGCYETLAVLLLVALAMLLLELGSLRLRPLRRLVGFLQPSE